MSHVVGGAPVRPPHAASPLDPVPLLRFYDEYARELPWRGPGTTPWSVLVSEIMLQQTPVARVIPVHRAWLVRWPTPGDLADAPTADVIRAWDRLGYPRRALRLRAAAAAIVERHGGEVPCAVDDLLQLPGIGEYTARAVATFAFRAREPVVDTNVRRVMSRAVRGLDEPGASAGAADRALMRSMLPAEPATAARFSIAVMELGALRCTAVNPQCDRCPVAGRCAWLAAGRPPGIRTTPSQRWHGTDRQVRGRMMAALRSSSAPVPGRALLGVADDGAQAARCLASLVADGLAVQSSAGRFTLPP